MPPARPGRCGRVAVLLLVLCRREQPRVRRVRRLEDLRFLRCALGARRRAHEAPPAEHSVPARSPARATWSSPRAWWEPPPPASRFPPHRRARRAHRRCAACRGGEERRARHPTRHPGRAGGRARPGDGEGAARQGHRRRSSHRRRGRRAHRTALARGRRPRAGAGDPRGGAAPRAPGRREPRTRQGGGQRSRPGHRRIDQQGRLRGPRQGRPPTRASRCASRSSPTSSRTVAWSVTRGRWTAISVTEPSPCAPAAPPQVIESSFGWHVIHVLERLPPVRTSLEERRRAFTVEARAMRGRKGIDTLLAGLHARLRIEVNPAAEAILRDVKLP